MPLKMAPTADRQMEPAMLEFLSPEVFQAIVDRLETGVYAVDLEQKISYWNYGAERITGFLSQNVLGPSPAATALWCNMTSTTRWSVRTIVRWKDDATEHARKWSRMSRHRSGHVVPVRLGRWR